MGDTSRAKSFSVLLVCYGAFPGYSVRAIRSLGRTVRLQEQCDVYVGCNACCRETLNAARGAVDAGSVTAVVESSRNLHKDPMLRHLLGLVETPYVLIMDDDSYVKDGWCEAICEFIGEEAPFDVAGLLRRFQRSSRYQAVVEQRPWWRGKDHVPEGQQDWILMCVGSFLLARTEFLRRHDFPDARMRIEYDDVMLADLVYQVGGRMLEMPPEVLSRVVMDGGARRWDPQPTADDRPSRSPGVSALAGQSVRAVMDLGIRHFQAGRFADADAAAQSVLQRDPQNAEALHLLGMVAHETGRHGLALELIGRAIAARPDTADFHNNFANVLAKMGTFDGAIASYQKAIRLRPNYAEAHNNLGNALAQQEQFEEAVSAYRRALELKPGYVEAHGNLGHALRRLGRIDEALESFRRAAALAPGHAGAQASMGLVYQDRGEITSALSALDKAVSLAPGDPQIRLHRAILLLFAGRLKEGWEEYEARLHLPDQEAEQSRFQGRRWDGASLKGPTILLHCEQGLGSTLQFIRYAPLLAESGARVVVECQPPLQRLLATSLPKIQVVRRGENLPSFDVHTPLMSVPAVLGTTLQTIPAAVPYLRSSEELCGKWRRELASFGGLKVGIAWQGNPKYAGDRQRSIPLKHYSAFARVPGVHLFSLQKRWGIDQLQAGGSAMPIIDLGPRMDEETGPFMDTAAVMQNLDLVITSDTSIAHLAGGLGVPVWVALCFAPDWRWMPDREDSPWYPTMRLFRQSHPGDWPGVFQRIARDLRSKVGRIA